jgi:RNA polymerase sigma-70 factor (ECF subfamily)
VQAAERRIGWSGLEDLRGALTRVLLRHGCDDHDVDDVIQETFLRAARYRSNLKERGLLRSWATRIALNVLADKKRREGRFRGVEGEQVLEGVEAPEDERPWDDPDVRLESWVLEKEAALRHMKAALASLKHDDRRVLVSFYAGAQSCQETALACRLPAHLVKVRLFRARQRLLRAMRGRLLLLAAAGARELST